MHLTSSLGAQQLARMARGFGICAYYFGHRRREIALKNLRMIYRQEKSEAEIRVIARKSFISFLHGVLEIDRFRHLAQRPGGLDGAKKAMAGLEQVLERARTLHRQTRGCIFVSPHMGNYAALPSLFSAAGIPLVIPVHELNNPEIHRRWWPLNTEQWPGSEIFVPRRNSLAALRRALGEGRSIGIMPDQRTRRGVLVDFLGAPAATTPVPAMLSLAYRRPILVCVCRRSPGAHAYEILLSEPLWPEPSRGKRDEILRLTAELNEVMGAFIRANPEQYFWVHDRWKPEP
jgi:KDO2-lipid IV(A) lauroyltransferase